MKGKVPRPFQMPWGRGLIVEEVSVQAPHWEPTIQLMEYEDGERSLRFCYYSEGRFGRGPMIIGEEHLEALGEAVSQSGEIKTLLRRLVGV